MIGQAQPPALDTLVAWANELGRQDVEGILQQILDQEKQTDQKLTRIAESMVNQRAQAAA
jgi:ferritin-like metal-binding protein YciE